MEHIIERFIIDNNLQLDSQNICVAVSTGVDSSVLLDCLYKMQPKYHYHIIICHVNHGQREQSNIEEQYIKQYALDKQMDIEVTHFTNEMFDNKNFQSEARNLRIKFFKEVLKKYHTPYIFLAHHLNDDIETSIMRIVRGSSLSGYAGMKEVTSYQDMIVLRPFLKVLKQDIYAYAKTNKIKYFEDQSNSTNHYTRNRIRHDVIPILFEENENFRQAFLEFKDKINNVTTIVNQERDGYIDKFVIKDNNKIKVDIKSFLRLSKYLQIEVLFEVLKKYQLSSKNIDEILKIINSHKPNISTHIKKLEINKQYNEVIIQEYNAVKIKNDVNIIIDKIGTYKINNEKTLEVIPFTNDNYKNDKKILINSNVLWYNSSMFPFTLRNRKKGDVITVGNGTKKVKDLLIDEKIPLNQRDNYLLLTKDEEVLTIFNLRKSSKVLSNKTNDILFIMKETKNEFK